MFCQPFSEAIAEGMPESIVAADTDLQPGNIFFAKGESKGASTNRSAIAYLNNSARESAITHVTPTKL